MKTISFLGGALLIALSTQIAGAALIAYEGFNYSTGYLADGTPTTASGFSGNWVRFLPAVADHADIISGSLSYGTLPTSANHLQLTHNRVVENLASSVGTDNTTLYLSLLYKDGIQYTVSNPYGAGGFSAFDLFRGGNNDAERVLSVDEWTGHSDSGSNIWVDSWSSGTLTASGLLHTQDTSTHLYVLKFNFGPANADSVNVYVDPPVGGAEPAIPTATISATDMSFDRLGVSVFTAAQDLDTDEVRLGSAYADVAPEPASLGLLAVGAVGLLRRRATRPVG